MGTTSPEPLGTTDSGIGDKPESHTNLKRFVLFLVPSGVAVGALLFGMAEGALAASFAVSGQSFKISADHLEGEGFVQYGWLNQNVREEAVPVAVAGIREADLQGMCMSVLTEFPIIGAISLNLEAGADGETVHASDLVIDMEQMAGNAEFTDMEIGRDAGTLDQGPEGAQGFNDLFGMQSSTIVVDDLEQTAWAANAGTFRLDGLRLGVEPGVDECF
ncbi:DUF6230 family protein [Nocardiopsis sp. LOL_012]|uniref:DUF6230 family protein n=1 Tax=Nocardiopsis sp. LOL_012 TaxID=3345409 RepID=UPI003A86855C